MNRTTENIQTESRMNLKQQSRMIDYKYKTIDKIFNKEPATKDNEELDAVVHEQG
jgi:hypothetical protein